MRSLIAAIDLGTTKVACIVGERIANKIKIIGYSQAPSKGIARGEVVNIQNVLDSITPVIHSVENGIGAKISVLSQTTKALRGKIVCVHNKRMQTFPVWADLESAHS